MEDPLLTRETLLIRIRDPGDCRAWGEFVDLYAPVIFRFALSRGVRPADAADLVQEVMGSVAKSIGRFEYRPEQAPFRAWLFKVTRNQIAKFYRAASRRPQGDGRTTLMEIAENETPIDDAQERWDREYDRQLFAWAAEVVRPEFNPRIWDAFYRTAISSEPAEEVAAELGMSVPAVYVAKCRCVARLKERILSAAGERWERSVAERSIEKSG
jgi:RNA polymerase sigma-70 factor (ECF subfamily)